jgi:DNA-binding MarR family transcriptional regulator
MKSASEARNKGKRTQDTEQAGVGSAPSLGLDAMLCFAIYGAAHAFTRTYKPLLDPLGLTYPQFLVMMALWDEDGQSVKRIGERLGLDSGTLSPLLKRLEQSGLVQRKRDAQDERQVRIKLTETGRQLQSEAGAVMQSVGRAVGCSLEEVEALREELVALKERLNKAE